MRIHAKDLQPGDAYDAMPLVEELIKAIRADEYDELDEWTVSVREAADNLWFEVEEVKEKVNGGYVVYGHPFNLPASEESIVETRED